MKIETLRARIATIDPIRISRDDLGRASVLVPFVARAGSDELDVLFERRAETRLHPGQIAFPGGRTDPSDANAIETALRETEEELGIARTAIEVLGELDHVITSSLYAVSPIAAYLGARPEVRASASEVAEALYIPFDVFLSEKTKELRDTELKKGVLFYSFGEISVWGATARILAQLVDRLRASA